MTPAAEAAGKVLVFTKDEAEAVKEFSAPRVETFEDGADLPPLKRRYCEEFVLGPHNRVQWRAYQAASGNPNVNTCSYESSVFMRDPRVKKYIKELDRQRVEALMPVDGEEITWAEAARVAKILIHSNNIGAITLTATRLASCIYAVNRVEGLPTATLDLHLQNNERILGAQKVFRSRMAAEQQKRIA